jgi:REP element-mobilizing transposase RayT
MPGNFSKIHIQVVFAVKARAALIQPQWEDQLYKYISGIISNKEQKLLAINGMPDHIHILIGMRPSCCLSDLVREIKKSSNQFINDSRFTPFKFQWQEGFGSFSYSQNDVDKVINYIRNQKDHHRKQNFRDEYRALLREFQIEYKDEFLFDWILADYK